MREPRAATLQWVCGNDDCGMVGIQESGDRVECEACGLVYEIDGARGYAYELPDDD